MRFERYEQVGEVFIIPTIKYFFDKSLFGFYCVDFVWLRWGFSLHWGYKKTKK